MRRWAIGLVASIALAGGSAVLAADAPRTLHVAFPVAETGFDPQAIGDTYSDAVCLSIFDPLYRYDYFARPVVLEPNTADGLPEITDGGRTYTIKVKRGIFFAADPAFNGKKRELTARGLRLQHQACLRSESPLVLAVHVRANARRTRRVRSSARASQASSTTTKRSRVSQALDRYTLRIRFKQPDYVFKWWLTTSSFAAVAREVVEKYQDDSHRVMENPVGTGPYRLKSWTRGQRIVLEANPDFRNETYPAPGRDPGDAAIAKGLTGRKLPLTGTVDIAIIEEAQPRLLSFDRGLLDYVSVPPTLAPTVLDGEKLTPRFAKRGIVLHRQIEPSLAFFFFNLDDPLVGGYEPAKIALRRAVALAYDREGAIRQLAKGQAIVADQPVPPGLYGNDPAIGVKVPYDPAAARALLDRFGYKDRDGDGYRETPDGKPLTLQKGSTTDAEARSARRAVETQHGRDRHPHHVHQEQVARVEQDDRGRPDDDVGPGVDQRHSRWRSLLQLPRQPQHRHVERRAAAPAGIRPAVRTGARAARRARTERDLPQAQRHHRQLRARGSWPTTRIATT